MHIELRCARRSHERGPIEVEGHIDRWEEGSAGASSARMVAGKHQRAQESELEGKGGKIFEMCEVIQDRDAG